MARNFHKSAFDESTKVKLDIFRDYIREWLPVWLMQADRGSKITIADLFAGPGRDSEGVGGSPLIAIDEIRACEETIRSRGARLQLELNEFSTSKANNLKKVLEGEEVPEGLLEFRIGSLGFRAAFEEIYPRLKAGPNLIILDQQGISAVTADIFNRLIQLPRTDFLFFIASSSLRRFSEHPHFKKYLEIPRGRISNSTFNDVHREVAEYYRELADAQKTTYLGKFSIKKGSNLYGVIFGSGHPLGLEKFLRACWKVDPERGEANFDIDDDQIDPINPSLFPEMDRPKKLNGFESSLAEHILSGTLNSDSDVYLKSLEEGFLPAHGRAVVLDLKKRGKIHVLGGQPRVSKDGYASPRRIEVLEE